ncbi:hypothetical protein [Pseudomonas aeruginosa]|uniref:hypothetical protein n=1 Tax=Pseudomonas aeruginosa TaxID=287 RepID=UPI003FD0497C
MRLIPNSSIPFAAWAIRSMITLHHKSKRLRPASLALIVMVLEGIATTVVFLVFNWVVMRSLDV